MMGVFFTLKIRNNVLHKVHDIMHLIFSQEYKININAARRAWTTLKYKRICNIEYAKIRC